MNKTIYSLEEDLKSVLETGEGWTEEISAFVGSDIAKSLSRQFGRDRGKPERNLRLSNLGTKCERKLWYTINWDIDPEPLHPFSKSKFIYGDLTESYILGLCMAAGHDVRGLQTELVINGIKGHRDCVIDGMLVDVKSCATFSFQNFTRRGVHNNDSYGYISQLSSYLYASRNDPIVTEKSKAAFIFVDKQYGNIAVRVLDLTENVKQKEEEVERKKKIVRQKKPPAREYETVFGKRGSSKNPALPNNPCGYCQHKVECWGDLHVYQNKSDGSRLYFTEIRKELGETWEKVND